MRLSHKKTNPFKIRTKDSLREKKIQEDVAKKKKKVNKTATKDLDYYKLSVFIYMDLR